jgi:hypothetical protein
LRPLAFSIEQKRQRACRRPISVFLILLRGQPLLGIGKGDSMTVDAIIGGFTAFLAGLIVNAPTVRSRLKTPTMRAAGTGLLAAVIVVGGVLIERLVFNAR